MVIQWIPGDTFTCLSTDTKPTLVPANAKAIETDTDNTYKFNGTSWVLFSGAGGLTATSTTTLSNKTISNDNNTLQNLVYDAIIYKSGTVYKGKLYDGTEVFSTTSGTTMQTGVQTVLDGGGLILWPSFGQYFQPGSTFTGWHLKSGTTLMMGSTRIILPGNMNQPNDAIFWIDDADQSDGIATNITLDGGITLQGGVGPTHQWTWMRMRFSITAAGRRYI